MKKLCLVVALLLSAALVGFGLQTSDKKAETTSKGAKAESSSKEHKPPRVPKNVVIDITADSNGDPQAADKKLSHGDSATWNNEFGTACRVTFDPFAGPVKVANKEKSKPSTISGRTPYGSYTYVLDCDAPKGGGTKGADPAIIVTP